MSKVTRPLPELVSKTVRTAFAHIEADRVESLELNFTDGTSAEISHWASWADKLASYDEAIRVARDLNDDFSNTEYLRGQAELIADLYGRVGVELGDRTIEVTNELKSGGEGNPKPGEPDYGDISEDQPPAHIDLQVEAADARAVQAATDAALSIETVKSANLRTSQLVGQSIAGVVYDGSVGIEFDVRLTRDGWVVNDDGGEEFSDLDLATALTKAINFNNG